MYICGAKSFSMDKMTLNYLAYYESITFISTTLDRQMPGSSTGEICSKETQKYK
jgi:hypothetical protein